jgi:hypothetical protein
MSQFNAKSLLRCLHTKKAHIRNLEKKEKKTKQWVFHTVAFPFTLKSIYLKAKEEF